MNDHRWSDVFRAQLLARAAAPLPNVRPALLPAERATAARKVKDVRHWAMRGDDTEFVSADAGPAVAAASVLISRAEPAFLRSAKALDP